MTTVYMFGAGASRGYRGSRTGVVPPLAKDYFSTFQKLAISADLEVKIGFIVNYVQDTRGISPQEQPKDFDEDVERVFAEVDRELRVLFDEPPDARNIPNVVKRIGLVKTYDQFVFWFSHILNEIQNGAACEIYGTLLERLQPNDALLTFNWDTILDRALYETGRWFPDDGYGVGFDGLLDGSWRSPRATVSSHLLLKLHGSTNWFGPYVTRHLQTGKRTWAAVAETSEPHWCLVNGTEWFSTYKDRWRPGYAPFSYSFAPNDPIADLALMPVVIPPKEEKDFNEYAPLFQPVWDKAHDAMRQSSRLVIAGYSFPRTDGHAFSLLDDFAAAGREIEIIDPYPDGVVERVKERVGSAVRISVHTTTLAGYLGLPRREDRAEISECDRIFGPRQKHEVPLSREEERSEHLVQVLIHCNLRKQYFDLTTLDGRRYLDCLLPGEFATHMYGAYREDVRRYRLANIPIRLRSEETVKISLDDICILMPIGDQPLSEEAISRADVTDIPAEVVKMICEGYHCKPDELDWFLRRFKAI